MNVDSGKEPCWIPGTWNLGLRLKTDRQTKNRIEMETNACTDGQMIFNKGAKANQWEKDGLFNKRIWEN